MLGLLIFLLGITASRGRDCNCLPCKYIPNGQHSGDWNLLERSSSSCPLDSNTGNGCLYVNNGTEAEKCFCDPGDTPYDDVCSSAVTQGSSTVSSDAGQEAASTEAASTSEDDAYVVFDNGPGCNNQDSITSPEECKTAAATIGLQWNGGEDTVEWSSAPPGCFVLQSKVYFNTVAVGQTGDWFYKSICRKGSQTKITVAPTTMTATTGSSTVSSDAGQEATSTEAACTSEGFTTITVSGGTDPGKKYLSSRADGYVDLYSNDDESGRQRWVLKHIHGNVYNILVSGGTNLGKEYLRSTADGKVDLWSHDDKSGRQRWIIEEIAEDTYNIKVSGGTNQGKEFLSSTENGRVDLYSQDDNSGRQKWHLNLPCLPYTTAPASTDSIITTTPETTDLPTTPTSPMTTAGTTTAASSVLFMRSNFQGTTWTTLNVPDFSPISAKCAVPDPLMEESNVFGQTINGKTYICDSNHPNPTSKCKSYNAKKNSWELEEGMKFQEKKRTYYSASTLVPGANPKWILTSYNAVEEWTPATGNWKLSSDYTLPSFSPYVPEIRQCIVPVDTKIMHIGGAGGCGWGCYHGRSGKVFLDDKALASLNVPRFQHTCINYRNKIYVAGGSGDGRGSPTWKVEVYDFSTNTWNYGPTLPIQTLDNFPKLKEIEGELYYIGGSGIGKIYKLGDQTWEEVATIPKAYRHASMVMEVTC